MHTFNKKLTTLSRNNAKTFILSILSIFLLLSTLAKCSIEKPVLPDDFFETLSDLDPKIYIVPTMVTEHTGTRGMPVDTVAEMSDFGFFSSYTNTTTWNAGSSTCVKMFNRKMIRDAVAELATGNTLVIWKYATTPVVEWNAASAASMYSFFAYGPYETGVYNTGSNPAGNGIVVTSTASTAGRPTLSYTVPSKVENQPDLMFAEPVYNLLPTGHPVRLLMRHALTAIGFRVAGGLSEKLTGLSITGVVVAGNAEANGSNIVWNLTGGKVTTDYSASINFDMGQSYYTVINAMTNPMKNDGWLMMLPQELDGDAKVRISLSDGTTREIKLKIDNTSTWEWEAGKRILYDIYLSPAGSTTVVPGNVWLPYPAQTPAAQTLSVVCLDFNGNPDATEAWTLSVPGGVTWLRLSTNSTGSPASSSVSGPGSKTVYLVADSNYGLTNVPRTVNLTLDGTTIATSITQEAFPGPGFTGWVYVKKDATGSGLSWNNALPTINSGLTTATQLRNAGFTVHGVLVAGGPSRIYNESVTSGDRIFGGWEGLAGTELPNNAGAPYTTVYRDLANYKAVISQYVNISGAGAAIDGVIVRGFTSTSSNAFTVKSGAYANAIEVTDNVLTPYLPAFVCITDSQASNILIARNNSGVAVDAGSLLLNATVVDNQGSAVLQYSNLINCVFWKNGDYTFTSVTTSYCAFPTGISAPSGSGNILLDPSNNNAWYSPTVTFPGPHFNLGDDLTKPYYSALNDNAPMLGSGNEALFNTNTLFMPTGYKKDINGKPRHIMGTDMGCYEDQELEGISAVFMVAPNSIWLSPGSGNASRTITVTSSDPWTVPALPANASLSVTSGSAGTTTISVSRSATVFGASSFDVKSAPSGETVTVHVDNYHITDDQFMLSNSIGLNTGTYDVEVFGGSGTFTIVSGSYPSWIQTAAILPNGKLELTANGTSSGASRTGSITLAHGSDPSYQVIFNIIQDISYIPPFDYLVVRFTWDGSDVDVAVEFFDPNFSVNYPTLSIPPFYNTNYPSTSSFHSRALGYGLARSIDAAGNSFGYQASGLSTFSNQELMDRLMFWGGDAQTAEGETVFFNAGKITPDDPSNDASGLPRYVYLRVYAAWYDNLSPYSNNITVETSTYTGGVMRQGTLTNDNHPNRYNFYNTPSYTNPAVLNNMSQTLSPDWYDSRGIYCPKTTTGSLTGAVYFREGGTGSSSYHKYYFCTIEYDRYRRSASVSWRGGSSPAPPLRGVELMSIPHAPSPKQEQN
ncbi:MAG: fimbrillin family protein [Bacteroidales bacterium]|nr:fimbrillin family protein [Bacteroidales bacterium]